MQTDKKNPSKSEKNKRRKLTIKISVIVSLIGSIFFALITGLGSNFLFTQIQNISEVQKYTITFESNGGNFINAIEAEANEPITVPEDPSRDGFVFYGWNSILPNKMPENDLLIEALWGIEIIDMTLGYNNGLVLASDGYLYSIGDNDLGQLGIGNSGSPSYQLNRVDIALLPGDQIIDFGMGYNHSVVLTERGQIYTWGDNNIYQLGAFPQLLFSDVPLNLTDYFSIIMDPNEKVIDIEVAMFGSIALTNKNRVITFGSNSFYGLGIGNDDLDYFYPSDISSSIALKNTEKVIDIDAVGAYYGILGSLGSVSMWGTDAGQDNFYEDFSVSNYKVPKLFSFNNSFSSDEYVVSFYMGDTFVLLITNLNQIYTFGSNYAGQLGNGTRINSILPINITNNFDFDENELVDEVFLGYDQGTIITNRNTVFMWGSNENNAILLETLDRSLFPNKVDYFDGNIINVIQHINENLVLLDNKKLFYWGNNLSVFRNYAIDFTPKWLVFDPIQNE